MACEHSECECIILYQEHNADTYRLTKPDLVDKGGETNVLDLVNGKKNRLRLGYCLVRNRGQNELNNSSAERHEKESEFFEEPIWSSLSKDRVGIRALQQRLQEVLGGMLREEMPKVKLQVNQRLQACQQKLAKLGSERQTPEQQRSYLQQMAVNFQRLTGFALDTYYGCDDVFRQLPELRLPTMIVNRSDTFSEEISTIGPTVMF